MGARHYRELRVWQHADALHRKMIALTARPGRFIDVRFRENWLEASGSICRNIAEGFGRYHPRDFARFITIARGSLLELQNHLEDAEARGIVSAAEREALDAEATQLSRSLLAFRRYLSTCRRKGTRAGGSGRM